MEITVEEAAEERAERPDEVPPKIPIAPTPPSIILPAAEAKKPEGLTAWKSTLQGWAGALGISGISFGAIISGIASQPLYIKLFIYLGVGGIVAAGLYAVVYMVIRAVHLRAREREAHELNLKQLEIYSDPTKTNVKIESPTPVDHSQKDGRGTWERIFLKREVKNA